MLSFVRNEDSNNAKYSAIPEDGPTQDPRARNRRSVDHKVWKSAFLLVVLCGAVLVGAWSWRSETNVEPSMKVEAPSQGDGMVLMEPALVSDAVGIGADAGVEVLILADRPEKLYFGRVHRFFDVYEVQGVNETEMAKNANQFKWIKKDGDGKFTLNLKGHEDAYIYADMGPNDALCKMDRNYGMVSVSTPGVTVPAGRREWQRDGTGYVSITVCGKKFWWVVANIPPIDNKLSLMTHSEPRELRESITFKEVRVPTSGPTKSPTLNPTKTPSQSPTNIPTKKPSEYPTKSPSPSPTKAPVTRVNCVRPKKCTFPFVYAGQTYHECTTKNHNEPWCSFDATYVGGWMNCNGIPSDQCSGSIATPIPNPICSPKKLCKFPFTYQGISYSECTRANHNQLWCSIDSSYSGRWVNCEAKWCNECKIPLGMLEFE